jgi:hypothetical protein
MNKIFDARNTQLDSTRPKLSLAKRIQYNREIAAYRGIYGCTDVEMGDVEAWARLRASIPEMAEVDKEIARYRRWERKLWRTRPAREANHV